MTFHTPPLARLVAWSLPLWLAGCASFSPDGGAAAVQSLTHERIGTAPTVFNAQTPLAQGLIARRSADLLQAPLSADGAIELAFLRNGSLQASFARLGVSEADLVQAGRLRNPVFNVSRIGAMGVHEIDRSFVFDVLGLLTMPVVHEVESRRHELALMQSALDAITLATQVRLAWVDAVAAEQAVHHQERVQESARISADLAARMVQAGNLPTSALLREQAFEQGVRIQGLKAQHQALVGRERLTRLLGLDSSAPLRLPDRLPDLPTLPLNLPSAEQTAMDQRLDLRMARLALAGTARSLGLSRSTRLVNVLEAGYQSKAITNAPTETGYSVALELPLFDFGQTRVARAEATYREALNHTAQQAIEARSQVRVAHSLYQSRHAVARLYRDQVVPLRQKISDENMLRHNGMFISVFDLLTDSREQAASVNASIESLRDFWRADASLQMALCGGAAEADASPAADAMPGAPTRPAGH